MGYTASVIIPVYNAEHSIIRCVESIVYGIYRNIEIILIEDCSKDNSWDVCCHLAKQYENVFCYQNDKNSGVSYTRNHGLQEAHGKYILFVDSDDWVSGRYAETLIKAAEEHENALVICGCHFHDNVAGYRKDYIWEENGDKEYCIYRNDFFDLPRKFHMQQLWNKVFHRDVIEKYQIRFDETQSMGEDFQFVLDYMEAAQIQQCVVLNEALYYYIRANSTSLMSKFGLSINENEYRRYQKLLKLSGSDNSDNIQHYEEMLKNANLTAVYQAVRAKNFTKEEKLSFIENRMHDGLAKKYYANQAVLMKKEKILKQLQNLRKIQGRIISRIQRDKNNYRIRQCKARLQSERFSIISQNCIGGVFYHDMEMKFLSPTINLFIREPDFVKFVLNLKQYINSELELIWGEEYPVGILGGDIHIDFMHYHSCSEAKEAWERRKKRINWDKMVIFATDRNGFTDEVFSQWQQIKYPKVLFTTNKAYQNDAGTVFFSQYEDMKFVPDLIPKREFYQDGIVIDVVNSLEKDK